MSYLILINIICPLSFQLTKRHTLDKMFIEFFEMLILSSVSFGTSRVNLAQNAYPVSIYCWKDKFFRHGTNGNKPITFCTEGKCSNHSIIVAL